MKIKVVIVTGSRKWKSAKQIIALKAALNEADPDMIVHGGALGADSVAHTWCKNNGKISKVYFPDYDKHGKGAPLKRNIRMLEDYPEALVIACPFPDSRGTYHTMQGADDRYMDVQVVPHGQ